MIEAAVDPSLSEHVRLWLLALLGPAVTALGFAFIYKQLQISARQAEVASNSYGLSVEAAKLATVQAAEQQNWKKAEFLANQVKDFFSDECVERTTYMLDWHIRKLVIADDDDEEVLTMHDDAAYVEAQNRPHLRDQFLNEGRAVVIARALRKHDDGGFTEHEAVVRDNFDWLFFRLGQFQHMIQSGLFTYQEVDIHLSYVLDLVSGGLDYVSSEVTAAIASYVREYDFPATKALMDSRIESRKGQKENPSDRQS
ncbi:hypothetical protein QNJ95_37165 [Bradyrhizobium elkanii]|uniref:hypothetical protein n=1 Tax=Bradyrhizobium elkanii TaxID=29448 RepID=UPI002711FD4F|nr:hypothetical protein [Bradyrhizobium elkanii]WLA38514.1 hypothetical protein QNJ95_37165 [Bradyrhizobium elkanii]